MIFTARSGHPERWGGTPCIRRYLNTSTRTTTWSPACQPCRMSARCWCTHEKNKLVSKMPNLSPMQNEVIPSASKGRNLWLLLLLGFAAGLIVFLWTRNCDIIGDLYDYSIQVNGSYMLQLGQRAHVDF